MKKLHPLLSVLFLISLGVVKSIKGEFYEN